MQQNTDHVLYLFGAGASAHAIPVINEMPDDMKRVAYQLQKWCEKAPSKLEKIVKERKEEIFTSLYELANTINSENENREIPITVDRYIKNLEGNDDSTKSRSTLATYFLLRQFFNDDQNVEDKRYKKWLKKITRDEKQAEFAK